MIELHYKEGIKFSTEVCAACHSMQYLSYRNLAEPGGPEFTEDEAKFIAASFEGFRWSKQRWGNVYETC